MSILVLLWLLPSLFAAALLLWIAVAPINKSARILAETSAGLLIAGLPFIITTPFTAITKIMLVILQLVVLMLAARIIFGRLKRHFVHQSTQLGTILYVFAVNIAFAAYTVGVVYPGILGTYQQRVLLILTAGLVVVAGILYGYLRVIRHYKLVPPSQRLPLKGFPTVSVCIPARNETHALQDCLTSVIASDYPKLEILVLDDCSHDNTSRIIKSFAQDGVRFLKGELPADGWLGKNQAMHTLAQQANGNYLLFIDVDTRLAPNSISDMIMYALGNKSDMLAVLPQNRLGLQPGGLLAPLRNFWQLVLPITRRHKPTASQCWLIRAQALTALGGFASVAGKIVPEQSFAVRLAATDGYRFIAGDTALGITTAKRWSSLYESSVRVLYPTYKRQPVYALAAATALLMFAVVPYVVIAWCFVTGAASALLWLSLLVVVLLSITYTLVLRHTNPLTWPLATLILPIVLVQEILFTLASMFKYEFGRVDWKGRNVCYPVIGQPLATESVFAETAGRQR